MGCEESYLEQLNKKEVENIFEVLGRIKYYSRSAKEETPEIRNVLSRMPANVLIFNREFKNQLFLHAYMNELKHHNENILAIKEFLEWVNISSNRDYKEEDQEQPNFVNEENPKKGSNMNAS